MNEVYVDDEDILMEALNKGMRWNGEKVEFREEWELEDVIEVNKKDDVRTMEVVCEMVNSIDEDIKMEATVASQGEGGMIPMLDFQAWSETKEKENGMCTVLRWK